MYRVASDLWHLGVVKGLFEQGLLPKVVAGEGGAAYVAALVGGCTDGELRECLTSEALALAVSPQSTTRRKRCRWQRQQLLATTDVDAFLAHIATLTDLTFTEAHNHTGRTLNILLPVASGAEMPYVLNNVTAPYVLVSSAIAASAIATPASTVTLTSRLDDGRTFDTTVNTLPSFSHWHGSGVGAEEGEGPLARISELFNTNHFIISRPMPPLLPCLDPVYRGNGLIARVWHPVRRLLVLEVQHRVRQMSIIGLLPARVAELLLEDTSPGAASTQLVISPEFSVRWMKELLNSAVTKSKERVAEAMLEGERAVWAKVKALRVRCSIEIEIERAYEKVRRRGPLDVVVGEGEKDGKRKSRKRLTVDTGHSG